MNEHPAGGKALNPALAEGVLDATRHLLLKEVALGPDGEIIVPEPVVTRKHVAYKLPTKKYKEQSKKARKTAAASRKRNRRH